MRTEWAIACATMVMVAATAQTRAADVNSPGSTGTAAPTSGTEATQASPVIGNPAANGGDANGNLPTEGTGAPLKPGDLGYQKGEPDNRPRIPPP